jgi:hypothetical protein
VRTYVEPVAVVRKSQLLKFSGPAKHQGLSERAGSSVWAIRAQRVATFSEASLLVEPRLLPC